MGEKMIGYYAIIPAGVRYDKRLSANAKLMYGEITALSNKNGVCWASNGYFADLYGVTKITISNWVSELEKAGYIIRKIIKDENNNIIRREIYLAEAVIDKEEIDTDREGEDDTPIKENFNTPYKKNVDPIKENFNTPIKENFNTPIKENFNRNNTSNNNTSNNNTSNNRAVLGIIDSYTDDDELIEALKGFNEMRIAIKSKLTPRAMKLALNKLDSLSDDINDKIEIVNQSTMNSWKSFYPLKKDEVKKEDRFAEYNFG